MVDKFILGTANFGMDYGIAFKRKVSKKEVFNILNLAYQEGVWGVDTAPTYGDAEKLLGDYFEAKGLRLRVITKLPKREYKNYKDIKGQVLESIKNLRIEALDYLLLHSYETFQQHGSMVLESLERIKEEGLIKGYGLSVYHPEEVLSFYNTLRKSFAVELPVNVFDQRFVPYLQDWKEKGFVIFGRSVFLQGLFFLENFKGRFEIVKDKIFKLRELSKDLRIELSCLLLSFVARLENLNGIIVGINSIKQLKENLKCFKNFANLDIEFGQFEVKEEDILLPYRWDDESI